LKWKFEDDGYCGILVEGNEVYHIICENSKDPGVPLEVVKANPENSPMSGCSRGMIVG